MEQQWQAAGDSARMRLCEARALTLFDLSAQQGNAEAFIQLGDFYYYQRAGLVQAERKKEAAEFYQKAADLHHTQAIFNLGIMHEVWTPTYFWTKFHLPCCNKKKNCNLHILTY